MRRKSSSAAAALSALNASQSSSASKSDRPPIYDRIWSSRSRSDVMSFSRGSNLPFRRACPWELRDRFNDLRISERFQSGELMIRQTYDGEPNPAYNQPAGTRSQAIEFLSAKTNELIA